MNIHIEFLKTRSGVYTAATDRGNTDIRYRKRTVIVSNNPSLASLQTRCDGNHTPFPY